MNSSIDHQNKEGLDTTTNDLVGSFTTLDSLEEERKEKEGVVVIPFSPSSASQLSDSPSSASPPSVLFSSEDDATTTKSSLTGRKGIGEKGKKGKRENGKKGNEKKRTLSLGKKGKKAPTPDTSKNASVSSPTKGTRARMSNLNVHGFRVGSDSALIVDLMLAGATDRHELNGLVEQAIANRYTRGGHPKNIPSLISGLLKRLEERGYRVEASWRLVPPGDESGTSGPGA